MTMHDKLVYENTTLCYICNEELGKDRVHAHCHLTGTFRGAAHEDSKIQDSKVLSSCISQPVGLW